MDVTCFLCDWAQEINGKLYVMGAGWNRLVANQPVTVAIAILVTVPWDQTNHPHAIRAALMTEDQESFYAPNGEPVQLEIQFEVGRPPGTRVGSAINAPFTMSFAGLPIPPGA